MTTPADKPNLTPPAARPVLRKPAKVAAPRPVAPAHSAVQAPLRQPTPPRPQAGSGRYPSDDHQRRAGPPTGERGRATPPAMPSAPRKPRLRKPRPGEEGYVGPAAAPAALANVGERLSKRIMQLKGCSRKEAEQFIANGFVQVNGTVVEEPAHRVDQETITIAPDASLLDINAVTLLLNKPAGFTDGLEELDDLDNDDGDDDGGDKRKPQRPRGGPARGAPGRKAPPPNARALLLPAKQWAQDASEIKPLKRHFKHLEADMELETGATGLVVFTQDWRTTRKLTEDLGVMEQEYLVEVKGEVEPDALKPILYALNDDRNDLPPVKVSVSSSTPEMSRLRFAVKGSHPGLIAYLCGVGQFEILGMRRVRLGRVALTDLPIGQWRYLAPWEKF